MYDYFMGTQLNPRVGRFDFKLFCEARPGLVLWVLINFSIAAKQWQVHHTVSTPMMLVCLFQFFYIMDYFFHEEAILTTWDIKHERFGWMLCFGDLVWVPFTYSLQAQYLLSHPGELPAWAIARHHRAQPGWVCGVSGAPTSKSTTLAATRATDLGQAGDVYQDRTRDQAPDRRILGDGPSPELPRRPDDGAGVVSDVRRVERAAVLLHHLLYDPARAP
jgi:hypothetical protein